MCASCVSSVTVARLVSLINNNSRRFQSEGGCRRFAAAGRVAAGRCAAMRAHRQMVPRRDALTVDSSLRTQRKLLTPLYCTIMFSSIDYVRVACFVCDCRPPCFTD